ncbi:hypothetical protein, partial [Tabrizicola aquatica]|uniref:hypothetical protein n=1 Tax=Tabrizicola aquatica TaxID=909926 RepID=UPI001CA4B7E8
FSLLRVPTSLRKYRLTETERRRKRSLEGTEAVVKRRDDNLEARRQLRQRFWCAACFVSALFDRFGNEGICGRFGRIGV